ncbi:MAG: flagellar biosynthetic protein FliR [Sedimentisphaerales bacterium]
MPAKLLTFAMVLTRISAFFLLLPVFGWKTIPVRVKVAVTVLMAIFFSIITPHQLSPGERAGPGQGWEHRYDYNWCGAILLIANEATYGLALGLVASSMFSVVKLAGRIIERQMGLVMAHVLDPLTGERTQPLGSLLEMIFIILFLSANGHHLFLLVISRSYEAFPAGSVPTISVLAGGVVTAGSAMFLAGLRLAAPMLAAFLILVVVLAVLARVVPEMNILFISLPLRVGLGLLMAALFLPLISGFIAEFADWMGKLLPL